jgi:Ca2+-binding EF-hand superfamily protein
VLNAQWFVNSDARLRSEVKEVFSRIDTNRDGFIDQDELLALLKTIHPAITPQVPLYV